MKHAENKIILKVSLNLKKPSYISLKASLRLSWNAISLKTRQDVYKHSIYIFWTWVTLIVQYAPKYTALKLTHLERACAFVDGEAVHTSNTYIMHTMVNQHATSVYASFFQEK
jgi:hypothetical protein